MVQHGEVAMSDPVAKYLPGATMPERNGKQITLRDLATHTSSLPRDVPIKTLVNPYAQYSPEQLYQYLSGIRLTRDIGSQWEYSNLGVLLLGHRTRKQCEALVPRFLRAVHQLRQAGLAQLVQLGQTLST
jgi:D-alanyl-D-alanine-carboxypeptidase/D-alanyl-D-alanine-endopeptidase